MSLKLLDTLPFHLKLCFLHVSSTGGIFKIKPRVMPAASSCGWEESASYTSFLGHPLPSLPSWEPHFFFYSHLLHSTHLCELTVYTWGREQICISSFFLLNSCGHLMRDLVMKVQDCGLMGRILPWGSGKRDATPVIRKKRTLLESFQGVLQKDKSFIFLPRSVTKALKK